MKWHEMTRDQRVTAIRIGVAAGCTGNRIASDFGVNYSCIRDLARKFDIDLPQPYRAKRIGAMRDVMRRDRSSRGAKVRGGVHLLDVGHFECRRPLWPDVGLIENDDYRFCGQPVEPGSRYCGECRSRMVFTWKPKRRGAA